MRLIKTFILAILLNCLTLSISNSEIVKKIVVEGNDRVTNEIILMFSEINIGQDIKNSDINKITKNLFESKFFENVSVTLENNVITILVKEAPLIEKVLISGIKAKKIETQIREAITLKPRSSFNKFEFLQGVKSIETNLKSIGYYFAEVEPIIETLDNNMINIEYKINLGSKAKIRKISFLGNKIFKDRKLKNIIISEEYKFWKFISGKKYLQEQLTDIDKRLLKNFYLNKGFYNVEINTSFAKLINEDEFEIIFNINAGKKIHFNEMKIIFPDNFTKDNYKELNNLFKKLKGEKYSIFSVEKILNEIDKITIQEEFKSSRALVREELIDDKLNIDFIIEESTKFFVEKVNIYGNNITQENVIRNQLEIDEGDPYNELLSAKSINNLKSTRLFKSVSKEVKEGDDISTKIINISVEEKPTGEITVGAGAGTEGGTIGFSVSENNFLGKGVKLGSALRLTEDSITGSFSVTNPNWNYSNKSLSTSLESTNIDKLTDNGYKTNKTGFSFGTGFEQFENVYFTPKISNYYEDLSTSSKASANLKKQSGDYIESKFSYGLDFDMRNQKFQTTDGFRSYFSQSIPIYSDEYAFGNSYDFKTWHKLSNEMITSFNFYGRVVKSLNDEDVRITNRFYIPNNKLKGFKTRNIGPVDGNDYIGGNYATAVNFDTTLPMLLPTLQNVDVRYFFDAANLWGVDYSDTIDESNKIRSSTGIVVDWFTPIGPLNFSLAQDISKASTDKTESFQFNLGTTF